MDNLVMEIKDYHSINEAKIEINKINVVGGVNGCGKSTVSKILYSFLKGNSSKRKEYVFENFVEDINRVIGELNYDGNEYNLPDQIKIDDDFSDIKKKSHKILKISKKHDKLAKIKSIELLKEIINQFNNLSKKLENKGFDVTNRIKEYTQRIIESTKSKNPDFEKDILYNLDFIYNKKFDDEFDMELIVDIVNTITNEHNTVVTDELKEALDIYYSYYRKAGNICIFIQTLQRHVLNDMILEMLPDVFPEGFNIRYYHDFIDENSIMDLEISEDVEQYILDYINIDNLLEMSDYFETYSNMFMHCRLFIEKPLTLLENDASDLSRCSFDEVLKKEFVYSFDLKTKFYFNTINSKIDGFEYFFNNNFIDSIYYVDNVSIFDLNFEDFLFKKLFHVDEIIEDIFLPRPVIKEYKIDRNIENILEKIENIIQGRYKYQGIFFETNKLVEDFTENRVFDNSPKNVTTRNSNTPSGIKQIGIIQLLLLNNKLKEDGYLIIDEPEVNLHPDWQFKFAEILVLLAKELNITIYLNSHSPFFIEAIDAFTEFYDMQDDINYYLSEESEKEGKYNFTKIESDELYKIYDNLGKPYDLIDQLRLEKHLGE